MASTCFPNVLALLDLLSHLCTVLSRWWRSWKVLLCPGWGWWWVVHRVLWYPPCLLWSWLMTLPRVKAWSGAALPSRPVVWWWWEKLPGCPIQGDPNFFAASSQVDHNGSGPTLAALASQATHITQIFHFKAHLVGKLVNLLLI